MQNLTPLILILPLLGFLILGLFGRLFSRALIAVIACGLVLAAFGAAVADFASMLSTPVAGRTTDALLWTWLRAGGLTIHFGLLSDPLSAVMLLIVTGVGFLIHVYSIGYMEDDPGFWRFFAYLNLFVFAMSLLVAADNFLFLLVGWAGVGLSSFLLIGFWYTRPSAVAAARKAFVVNVIGDFGLMIAIFMIAGKFGTLQYGPVLSSPSWSALHTSGVAVIGPAFTTAVALLLFVAAAAKSAQLPLHVWLPDAMEGPTPVSALIHAATMVTAGVYLVARASTIFSSSPTALATIGAIGGITALFAATIACVQTDIKRVLAYSTMSQLGYMFMAESVRGYSTGIFHLTTHAYFKALLFMAAGAVIHALGGEQDMRKMGGLRRVLPRTFWLFVAGGLALAAIVPFAGFWSKDAVLGDILQYASTTGGGAWYALYGVGLLTAGLTGFYVFRLIFVVFLGEYRGPEIVPGHSTHEPAVDHPAPARLEAAPSRGPLARVHDVGAAMLWPMVVLAVLSLIGGLYGSPWTDWIGSFLAPVLPGISGIPAGSALFWISLGAGLIFALAGIGVAWARYGQGIVSTAESHNPIVVLLEHRYYVDAIYNVLIIQPIVWTAIGLRTALETWTLAGGSLGAARVVGWGSAGLRRLQTGYARNYALAIFVGAGLMLLYYVTRP